MDAAIRDSLVTGHSQLVDSLTLPDPDDRHVLAAAIHSGAGLIVTFNSWTSLSNPWPRTA